ncbi:MAG: nucleotide exchange factor GrpE [Patescibacteria group bacterium]|nr:nucleotide exchange factor GrpE [Patescibacteria group bacterium]
MEKKLEKLEKEIVELQEKVQETENKWKRALADYQNLEKRTNEQKIEFIELANHKVILDFLDVLDCLEDSAKHIKNEGLNLSVKKFKDALLGNGVSEIQTDDVDFDHNLMEAVDTQKGTENKVLKVNKKGYILNNKVLRPAQVVVGRKE